MRQSKLCTAIVRLASPNAGRAMLFPPQQTLRNAGVLNRTWVVPSRILCLTTVMMELKLTSIGRLSPGVIERNMAFSIITTLHL